MFLILGSQKILWNMGSLYSTDLLVILEFIKKLFSVLNFSSFSATDKTNRTGGLRLPGPDVGLL